MEEYFKEINDEKYDVLIGNGFTINNKSREFDYEEFTQELSSQIGLKINELAENIFFDKIVSELSNVGNIEEYILQLKKFKGIASRTLSEEEILIIDEIYNLVYKNFVEEFTRKSDGLKTEKKIPQEVDNIFSTNLFPDFNILVNAQKDLPTNFINPKTNLLFSNSYYTCGMHTDCISCYVDNCSCGNTHMVENYFYKTKIFYIHGSTNVWFGMNECNEYEYCYTSRVNDNFENKEPLFIIDGNGEGKEQRINEHEYTRHCLNAFKNSENNLLVFGNSLSEQDSHIVNIISEKLKQDNFELYVALYSNKTTKCQKENDYAKGIVEILSKFSVKDRDKIFFIESDEANKYILN